MTSYSTVLGRIFSIVIVLFFSINCFSQEEKQSIEGTYQVQVVNSRNQPNVPGNLEQIVREKRHNTEDLYITIGTDVRLFIPSEKTIRSKTFIPLKAIAHVVE